jgi:hypothetical protein
MQPMQTAELTDGDLRVLVERVAAVTELEEAIAGSPYSFLATEHRRVLSKVLERL